jgi:hypothetical protein
MHKVKREGLKTQEIGKKLAVIGWTSGHYSDTMKTCGKDRLVFQITHYYRVLADALNLSTCALAVDLSERYRIFVFCSARIRCKAVGVDCRA